MGKEAQVPKTETEPRPPKYKLLIFDFHGTITDHQLRLIHSLHHSAHDVLGIHWTKEFYQDALSRPSHQRGTPETNAEFIKRLNGNLPSEVLSDLLKRFDYYMTTTYMPIPNMQKVIKELQQRQIEIVLLTNGSNREVILEALERFDIPFPSDKLYSSHITGARKPDPQTVGHIIRQLEASEGKKLDKSKVLMIGDYQDDTRTANNLGIDSVLITRGNGWERAVVRQPKPTFFITDPLDLLEIVDGNFLQDLKVGDVFDIPPILWPRRKWGPK